MREPRTSAFAVVDGGKAELERKKVLLFATPEVFDGAEFESLCDTFGLGLAEVEALIARRVRLRAKDALERDALLAIIRGNLKKAHRLHRVIRRRNALGLRVVTS